MLAERRSLDVRVTVASVVALAAVVLHTGATMNPPVATMEGEYPGREPGPPEGGNGAVPSIATTAS